MEEVFFYTFHDNPVASMDIILYLQISHSLGIKLDYDESELSHEVPYLPASAAQKYLPSPPVFVAGLIIVIVLLLVIIGLVLYFTLS